MNKTILIAEDEDILSELLVKVLTKEGYKILQAYNGVEALKLLEENQVDLILSDLKMPEMDGMKLLKEIKNVSMNVPVIIMTAFGTIETAVEAMKLGAYDFIVKPFQMDNLKQLIINCFDNLRYTSNGQLHNNCELDNNFIKDLFSTNNPVMEEVLTKIKQVAAFSTKVLIRGESGTGKELVAKAIHYFSPRKNSPFIAVNCAAIPENLLESELFGHEKGAFTGANSKKLGKFELANGGTLFLDEIGDMSLPMQAKLLRVLQENIIERIGGNESIAVDVRVISATNRNLESDIQQNTFREDLFYRLNAFPIQVPALRDRKEDIPLLTLNILNKLNKKFDKLKVIDDEVIDYLATYDWPGNIRELENSLEQAMVLSTSSKIAIDTVKNLLNVRITLGTSGKKQEGDESTFSLKSAEYEYIVKALEETEGNRKKASELLGISLRALQYKLKEYNLLSK